MKRSTKALVAGAAMAGIVLIMAIKGGSGQAFALGIRKRRDGNNIAGGAIGNFGGW